MRCGERVAVTSSSVRAIRPRGVALPHPPPSRVWLANAGNVVWVLPVFTLLAFLLAYPLASGLLLSLQRTTGSTPGEFVGLDNYTEALFRDDIFHQALGNTVAFTAVAIVLQTGVGLLLAILISELRHGRLPYRVIFFAPVVLSAVAIGSVWKWLYAPYFATYIFTTAFTVQRAGYAQSLAFILVALVALLTLLLAATLRKRANETFA